jgi:protein gp37
MSDLFHKDSPDEFILRVFGVMRQASQHTFQVLTKRSDRLLSLSSEIDWPENVWMGVSVERANYKFRIDHLRETGAKTRFLSLEPLLGPLKALELDGIHWVIAGGESGPGARPMLESWVVDIRDQCVAADVPFFFKQWGGVFKKRQGRLLDGVTWDELPERCEPRTRKRIALTVR